jgi:tetrahydromethanopterin S-methyltransferase subunit G|tara:strand:+ start:891 stop:1124 length:234 start_codon:yes stop_codon:yes gene_type:complete
MATALEKKNLEAHVDLCQERYEQLDNRLTKIEEKVEHIHHDITHGNKTMIKVMFGATATIITGLLSTIIVVINNFPS